VRYIALLLGLAALATAAETKFSGYLWDDDSATFVVRPTSELENWEFTVPGDVYFWVKVYDGYTSMLEDFDLSEHKTVTVKGAKGKRVLFKIYAVAGEGKWSAASGTGSAESRYTVTLAGTTPKSGRSTATPTDGGGFTGTIVEPDTARFSVTTRSDPETWKFEIPSDAYFWMKIDDENGRELDDLRLQTSRYVKLVGGGKFSFRLYTVGGDGAWSAKRMSGSGDNPHVVSKSAGKPSSPTTSSGRSTANPKPGGRFEGVIVEPDTARFSVTTKADPETWKFEIPSDAYFWMKIDDAQGNELDDVRLQTSRYVRLVGGGKFSFRLYTVGGDGSWSAKRISGSGENPHVVTAATAGTHSGALDENGAQSFVVVAQKDPEDWKFTWPSDADFRVRVHDRDGDELGDFDLSEGSTITLRGGGKFTLEVRSEDGRGAWTAKRQ